MAEAVSANADTLTTARVKVKALEAEVADLTTALVDFGATAEVYELATNAWKRSKFEEAHPQRHSALTPQIDEVLAIVKRIKAAERAIAEANPAEKRGPKTAEELITSGVINSVPPKDLSEYRTAASAMTPEQFNEAAPIEDEPITFIEALVSGFEDAYPGERLDSANWNGVRLWTATYEDTRGHSVDPSWADDLIDRNAAARNPIGLLCSHVRKLLSDRDDLDSPYQRAEHEEKKAAGLLELPIRPDVVYPSDQKWSVLANNTSNSVSDSVDASTDSESETPADYLEREKEKVVQGVGSVRFVPNRPDSKMEETPPPGPAATLRRNMRESNAGQFMRQLHVGINARFDLSLSPDSGPFLPIWEAIEEAAIKADVATLRPHHAEGLVMMLDEPAPGECPLRLLEAALKNRIQGGDYFTELPSTVEIPEDVDLGWE